MRIIKGLFCALLIAGVACAIAPPAEAQLSTADASVVQSYTLNTSFFDKWKIVQSNAAKDPCNLDAQRIFAQQRQSSSPESLEKMAEKYDVQPGVHAMLASQSLTAREYLIGVVTLLSAGMQDMAQAHPDMAKMAHLKSNVTVSPANMAFYRQHKDEMHQFMQQLGQQTLRENGGKPPICSR